MISQSEPRWEKQDNFLKPDQRRVLNLDPVQPLELLFKNIQVDAQIQIDDPQKEGQFFNKKKSKKTILHSCSGKFSPGTFTALLGPSGSGKTTMLNLLSGRLNSDNLTLYGILSINGKQTDNVTSYKNKIGYVMQDDIILATFTPQQTFKFVADLRLVNKTQNEKNELISKLIIALGLMDCKDTYIGNSLIKGISGGQMKRTSIGIQLLINPSILFLDQPTTGLDSKTALDLIHLLNELARAGRTIISTIHQPSSQIFLKFDRLMLMVDGHIIYNAGSKESIKYFQQIGLPVPANVNPFDHYIQLMNKQEMVLQYIQRQQHYDQAKLNQEFDQRRKLFIDNYKKTQKRTHHQILQKIQNQNQDQFELGFCGQILVIMRRSFISQFRNPMDVIAKIIQTIFFSAITIIFFEKRATNFANFDQNLNGAIFFVLLTITFAGIFGILNVFNAERAVFFRQRSSGLYHTIPYFIARNIATLPGTLIVPVLYVGISYFPINLYNTAGIYFFTIFAAIIIFWMSQGYGLFLSSLVSDPVMVMSLVPMIVFPLMVVSGFFIPLSKVFDLFRVFEYISVFKYGYQALMQIQYIDGAGFSGFSDNQYPINPKTGLHDPNYILYTDQYNFDEALWLSLLLLFLIGFLLKALSAIVMKITSQPKKMKLLPPAPQMLNQQMLQESKKRKSQIIQIKSSNIDLQIDVV